MATKKKTSKKTTTKRASVKKKSTAKRKVTAKVTSSSSTDPAFMQLAYGLFAAAITYGFVSWAIDSGSMWLYLASFIGLYLSVSYIKAFVKLQFFK